MSTWIKNVGHEMGDCIVKFPMIFVGGKWRERSRKWDSGLYTMLLMKSYTGDAEYLTKSPILQVTATKFMQNANDVRCL